MAIKQESMIEMIKCAQAWRKAYMALARDISMTHRIAEEEDKNKFWGLINASRHHLPSYELTSPIDIQANYYKGRGQENFMRRAVAKGLKAEQKRKEREKYISGAVMSDEELERNLRGYAGIPREVKEALAEPTAPTPSAPQEVHTPPHPPGATYFDLGAPRSPSAPIDPFAGLPDKQSEWEKEILRKRGIRGDKG